MEMNAVSVSEMDSDLEFIKMVESQEGLCEEFKKVLLSIPIINKDLEHKKIIDNIEETQKFIPLFEMYKEQVAQVQEEEQIVQELVAQVQEQVPQVKEEEQIVQELVAAPVQVEKQLSEEFLKFVESMPETTHTLIANYNSYSNLEKTYLCNKLRGENADILNLLEFYMNDIYPGDYYFGIPFALNAIVKQKQSQIVEKIKSGIELSNDEENILDDGSHSGCSFCGLMYWLKIIFQKMQGDSLDNYHIVFNEKGEKRIVPLFEKY